MSETIKERLYNLLPAVYRIRDADQGEPLRALLAAIEREMQAAESDIEGLYDNMFIETCDEWVVPYIGDQLGVHGLNTSTEDDAENGVYSLRSYVANTLAYRRRKGTATVLEQLTRDITGWPARAVEFFQLLATTQNLNHVRSANIVTPDLRDMDALELLGGPFESAAHTVDVRSISSGLGRYNIPNIGLFLWRLQSYLITCSTVRAVADLPGRYTFSSLGNDVPLFNLPQTEEKITHLAEEINVPGRLRRRPLYDELEALRQALVKGEKPNSSYFGVPVSVFEIFFDDENESLSPEEIIICDLSGWDKEDWQPPNTTNYTKSDNTEFNTKVAVDPVLGRLAILKNVDLPNKVFVSYSYGFSGDVGGGPYPRYQYILPETDTVTNPNEFDELIHVSSEGIDTIAEALKKWKDLDKNAVIQIDDNRTYKEDEPITIDMNTAEKLVIQAANGKRPTLIGDVTVTGGTGNERLILNGLLISGNILVEGNLKELDIVHCTLVPSKSLDENEQPQETSVIVDAQYTFLQVLIDYSIVGSLRLPKDISSLTVRNSIIRSPQSENSMESELPAIAADENGNFGPQTTLEKSTVFGSVSVKELMASDVIFNDTVEVERRQVGCIRFSYVPNGSPTPRRYRCQPDMALTRQVERLKPNSVDDLQESEKNQILSRIKPTFTSVRYGDPGFAQLTQRCAKEICTGAENESEMGVFNYLKQPQREENLRAALDEYLRLGLEAGIFYIS